MMVTTDEARVIEVTTTRSPTHHRSLHRQPVHLSVHIDVRGQETREARLRNRILATLALSKGYEARDQDEGYD